ncbi:MAG: Molybdopterin molybdenumtransferase [Firmicutes bacterium]|nr:Molybdopterin molybdenumtransferase [Bacillota bacterium]
MKQRFLHSIAKDDALRLWLAAFSGREAATEVLPVSRTLERITATPVVARESSPHYAASAMDGIAVEAKDTIGAAPGRPCRLELQLNCFAVDTGDPMPPGTDAVIMIENVVLVGTSCDIEQGVAPWQNVRPVGEDIIAGEILLPRYHCLSPVDLGALLAAGVHSIAVLAKPRVTIIPTGDELVLPGTPLQRGDIVEFNSAIIAAEIFLWGGEPLVYAPVPDDAGVLQRVVEQAIRASDMVLIIAGSSTGRGDYTADVVEQVGEILVHGVAMRPGKPVMLAKAGLVPVVGLPGYPVSAHHCLETFVKPLLYAFNHRPLPKTEMVDGLLTRRLVSPFGVEEFVRVAVGQVEGQVVVTPLARGAGIVSSLMRSDGTVIVPQSAEGFAEGASVRVLLRKPLAEISGSLVCIGSHDLVLDVLADYMRLRYDLCLQASHVGSMGGLLSLKRNFAHLCTTHLLDEETGEYNTAFIKRMFPGEDMVAINLVERWQGFMCRVGTGVKSWQDLRAVRFINRQRGSGTRVLLDYHLHKYGLESSAINGYLREETTHLAVACAVANGSAEVGLGILSAANAFGLDFVPICLEQFDIVMRRATLHDPRIQALLSIIRSAEFASRVGELGGYATNKSGEVVWTGNA